MQLDGQRRSDNLEDRGRGRSSGGGVPVRMLLGVFRLLGPKGTVILLGAAVVGYVLAPESVKQALVGGGVGGSACEAHAEACDFSSAVLASTEDVWAGELAAGRVPGGVVGP